MNNLQRLKLIKLIHTLIWVFYNVVIFYMLYASLTNRIDRWLWMGFGLVFLEVLILLLFRFYCPLTILARRYTKDYADNFDIYLPLWLAKNNKLIYSSLVFIILVITIVQLFRN